MFSLLFMCDFIIIYLGWYVKIALQMFVLVCYLLLFIYLVWYVKIAVLW